MFSSSYTPINVDPVNKSPLTPPIPGPGPTVIEKLKDLRHQGSPSARSPVVCELLTLVEEDVKVQDEALQELIRKLLPVLAIQKSCAENTVPPDCVGDSAISKTLYGIHNNIKTHTRIIRDIINDLEI